MTSQQTPVVDTAWKSSHQLGTKNQGFVSEGLRLLDSGSLSDSTITCEDQTWHVHKVMLCSRSDYFKKAFTGSFEEARTSHVHVQSFTPVMIGYLLHFLYGGDILRTLDTVTEKEGCGRFRALIILWALGDYFLIPALGSVLKATFKEVSNTTLDYVLGGGPEMGDAIAAMCEGITTFYIDYPHALNFGRYLVLSLGHNIWNLSIQSAVFRETCVAIPDFAADVLNVHLVHRDSNLDAADERKVLTDWTLGKEWDELYLEQTLKLDD